MEFDAEDVAAAGGFDFKAREVRGRLLLRAMEVLGRGLFLMTDEPIAVEGRPVVLVAPLVEGLDPLVLSEEAGRALDVGLAKLVEGLPLVVGRLLATLIGRAVEGPVDTARVLPLPFINDSRALLVLV